MKSNIAYTVLISLHTSLKKINLLYFSKAVPNIKNHSFPCTYPALCQILKLQKT